jgi:hypothetical protein
VIETVRNPSGEIVYRARITRLQPDGSKKYFQKPVTKSYAQAQKDLILLKEEYPPMTTGRKPGGGLGVGQLTDEEAYKKFKKSIDKKFKNGAISTKKWSKMTKSERANIASDANFLKKLDERVLEVQLGDKKVKLPKGMRVTSIAGAITPIEEFYKKLLKWKKNPTAENWTKTVGFSSTAKNFRKYLLGGKPATTKSLTPQTFNLFENLNLKSAVNANEIKTINSLSIGDTSLRQQASKKNFAKATKLKQDEILNQLKILDKDPVVKQFIKKNDFSNKEVARVSKYVGKKLGGIGHSAGARRLQELASAYVGKSDYLNLKSNDRLFMQGIKRINDIVQSSIFKDFGARFKRDLYEKEISKALKETPSFMQAMRQKISKSIPNIKRKNPKIKREKIFEIDEIKNIASGAKQGTPGYSVFVQGIDSKINSKTKKAVDRAVENAESKLQELNPLDPNYEEKRNIIKNKYNEVVRNFVRQANKGYSGNLPVRAFELSFDEPIKSVSRFNDLPKNVSNLLTETYDDFNYSFKVPRDVKTIYEAAEISKNPDVMKNLVQKALKLGNPRVFAFPLAAYLGYEALPLLTGTPVAAAEVQRDAKGNIIKPQIKQPQVGEPLKYDATQGSIVNANTDQKADQNQILEYVKDNPLKVTAGTSLGFAAQEVPGAYKAARDLGRGRVRSALGISGALRPILTTFGTPLMTGLYEGAIGSKRLEEGETMTDILTDPLGPALGVSLMEPLSKLSGVVKDAPKRTMLEGAKNYFNLSNVGQARPGITGQILRMGMIPRMIAGASRFLGLPGLALGLGMSGYDAYKNYQNQEGMIYNLFNRDE